jgi:hypothetical protein
MQWVVEEHLSEQLEVDVQYGDESCRISMPCISGYKMVRAEIYQMADAHAYMTARCFHSHCLKPIPQFSQFFLAVLLYDHHWHIRHLFTFLIDNSLSICLN